MKNPVKNIMIKKILPKPSANENISLFDLVFKLKATNIGIIGKIHGDKIEIIPVKNEIKGSISI